MHEFSVAAALIRQVEQIARREGAGTGEVRVQEVKVNIGEFSGVDAQLLESAFEQLIPHTLADRSRLITHSFPLEALCELCHTTFPVRRFRFSCPQCSSTEVVVVQGEELILDSVTLEGPDQ